VVRTKATAALATTRSTAVNSADILNGGAGDDSVNGGRADDTADATRETVFGVP